jgi:hypothetical protein
MRTKRATNCATAPNPDRSVNRMKNTSAAMLSRTPGPANGSDRSHAARNDSPTSTGTLVETFSWAARAISLPKPSLINS